MLSQKFILLPYSRGALPRLRALERSRDGFRLAELDLQLRGPGHLLGKKQSGHLPEFAIARLDTDEGILNDARAAAEVGMQSLIAETLVEANIMLSISLGHT